MKEYFINTLQIDEEFIDFFMVKAIGVKVGSNKKNYLDVTLGDSTGEINGKKWDVSDEELKNLSAIKEGDSVILSPISKKKALEAFLALPCCPDFSIERDAVQKVQTRKLF